MADRRALLITLGVALASLSLLTLGAALWPVEPKFDDIPTFLPVAAAMRWDAGWYGAIARDGYWISPGNQSPVAYFPLFPMAMRLGIFVGLNRWVAGVLFSFAFGVAALLTVRAWARVVRPGLADSAWLLLLLWPFAEYLFGVVYSDGLFLLLAASAFLALEKDKPAVATALGALAAATRPVAPALVLGLLVRSIERRQSAKLPLRAVDLLPALAGLGLAAYMGYLQLKFGDALAFVHVHSAPGWDQGAGWRTWFKVEWFHQMFPRVAPLVAVRLGGHALASLCACALLWPTFKRLGWGYGVYCLIALAMPLIGSKDFQGLGRYIIAAFPLFLCLAELLEPRPRLRLAYLAASALLLATLAVGLGAGGYVS